MTIKENFILNVITNLATKLSAEDTNLVKIEIEKNLYNIELSQQETHLTTTQGETAQIIKKFIACKKIQGLTERTLKYYLCEIGTFFKTINKDLINITTDDIRWYFATCQNTCSNVTINNKRRCLSSLFEWCVTEEIINKNPVRKIPKIKCKKEVKSAFKDIEIEQMRDYLNKKDYKKGIYKNYADFIKVRNIAIFETLLSTGCRISELINATLDDLDLDNNELKVLGKGNKERICYLNAKSVIALKNYLEKRNINNFENYIFLSNVYKEHGKMLTMSKLDISSVECIIRKLGKELGIKAHPHKFRRTAATSAINKGMPIQQVQKMLGHANLDTTQIYVETKSEEVKYAHSKYLN